MGHKHAHFEGKDALEHVVEAQARGLITANEIHGTETPGHISSAADSARETAIVLILVETLLHVLPLELRTEMILLAVFALGWTLWKMGRSAWLGWFRLERLHRVLMQEKWEIEHNRDQEREELGVLYQAKGFQGQLLEDVLDVLMADGDRLLKVMVEEELGLTLENQEHPLKQGLGAAIGSVLATAAGLLGLYFYPSYGLLIAGLMIIALASGLLARFARNDVISAVVWNLGLAILATGAVYFVFNTLLVGGKI